MASKTIYFNPRMEEDLLSFANNVNFSKWVKDKIREEINGTTTTVSGISEDRIREIVRDEVSKINNINDTSIDKKETKTDNPVASDVNGFL